MSENGWWLEVQVGSREAFIEVEEITVISYDDGTDGRGGKKLARAGEGVSLCTFGRPSAPVIGGEVGIWTQARVGGQVSGWELVGLHYCLLLFSQ